MSWFFCKPNGEGRLLAGQVGEINLKGLLIPLAHALDAIFVDVLACRWISKRLKEVLELPADKVDDVLLLDPLGKRPF